MREPLGSRDVHLHYGFVEDLCAGGAVSDMDALSAEEQGRAARFVVRRDRLAYVAAHVLLRQALSSYSDLAPDRWQFEQNAYGKPRLAAVHGDVHLQFSLTHTRGLVACAICRHDDVGVDAESVTPRVRSLDVAERFFSPSEVSGLKACAEADRDVRFVELWTLKESYIKALGVGLSHPLETFGFTRTRATALAFEPPAGVDALSWQFELQAPSVDYRLAVGIRRATAAKRRVRTWQATSSGLRCVEAPCILGRFNF